LQNVEWISEPIERNVDGRKALFLPHTSNYKEDWKNLKIRDYDLVFTHQTFAGAKAESGQELDGIPTSVFSKDQMVISGDVHVPQKVGPVLYVGAPYTIDFGDDLDRHMILLDSGSGEIKYIPYDGPSKIMLDLPLGFVLYRIENLKEGDIVKVRVSLNADQFAEFQEYKEEVTNYLQQHGCIVHMIQPVFDKGGPIQTRRRLRKRSDEEVLKSYALATGIKESTIKTGVRLMRKRV
jgi:hypothetical protein